jgi:hypothetical protein
MKKSVDLTDKKFGRLTVIKQSEYYIRLNGSKIAMWLCKCDCGNTKIIRASNLQNGTTKSCGCLSDENRKVSRFKDLTGKIFGRLTVIELADKLIKPNNKFVTMWKCKCECGNEIIVRSHSLISKNTKSCGCLYEDTLGINYKYLSENIVYDTNIKNISSKKMLKNNTSGYKGVYWNCKSNKWNASIIFQKKYYNLGYYEDIKDAAEARKIAEEKVFGNFLKWYYNEYQEKKKNEQKIV